MLEFIWLMSLAEILEIFIHRGEICPNKKLKFNIYNHFWSILVESEAILSLNFSHLQLNFD